MSDLLDPLIFAVIFDLCVIFWSFNLCLIF
jgi:hypothetical protein